MQHHVRPIHLIGALSPADVERLVIRLVEVSGRRNGQPEVGEPLVGDVALTCSAHSVDDGAATVALSATARAAGGGELKSRFQVEVDFAEGRHRALADPRSPDLAERALDQYPIELAIWLYSDLKRARPRAVSACRHMRGQRPAPACLTPLKLLP